METTSSMNKVGPLIFSLLVHVSIAQEECSLFRQEYCNLRLDKIMMLDTGLASPAECQTACFERKNCTEFTYFEGTNSRCVLFNQCSNPVSSCKSCISGPPFPRVGSCGRRSPPRTQPRRFIVSQVQREISSPSRETTEEPRAIPRSNGPSRPVPAGFEGSFRNGVTRTSFAKDSLREEATGSDLDDTDDEYYDTSDVDINSEDDGESNIDDGLLDAVFDELPGTGQTRPPPPPRAPTRPSPPRGPSSTFPQSGGGGFYYCIMGGSDVNGPVSTVSVMNIGTYAVPRTPLIAPFPSFMTQGSGDTFSVFNTRSLHTCTPGYYARTLLPASTFGPQGFGFAQGQSYVPGSCNEYDFSTRQWTTSGGKMTTSREGGTTLNVGSYIMTFGGFNTFGQPVNTVEIFDPRRPRVGWQNVPQWSFPRATRDHCSVVTRDPVQGTSVLVMGGQGEEDSAMKLVLGSSQWYSVPPMHHARSLHGCTSVTLNGRPGVVVSGGWDGARLNTTTSVEFFDMNTHRWVDLPDLSRGRRGHSMTTIDCQLAVVGGVAATGFRGEQDEYLGDVEVFDGRRWKRAAYGLDQPRNGANLIKIPFDTFSE